MDTPTPPVVPATIVREPSKRSNVGRVIGAIIGIVALGGVAMFALMWYAVVTAVSSGASTETHAVEHYHSLAKHGANKIAIISVEGTIMDGDGFAKKQIDQVRQDKSGKAVVLRVDSPGGTVTGSDFIYHHLVRLREERKLPIVVSMGGLAASGGYYVSMAVGDQEESIFAEPTCWTGSIGVIIPHYDLSGLAERFDIKEDAIKSHRLKQMGSMLRPMTEEEQKIFQGLVDESFTRFKKIVMDGRPEFRAKPDDLDKVATGQIFTTQQAIESGLVDKEGFIEAAIDRALDLAKLDKTNTKVVKYKQPFTLFEGLLASSKAQASPLDLRSIVDLSTPRAWFLCSWPLEQR